MGQVGHLSQCPSVLAVSGGTVAVAKRCWCTWDGWPREFFMKLSAFLAWDSCPVCGVGVGRLSHSLGRLPHCDKAIGPRCWVTCPIIVPMQYSYLCSLPLHWLSAIRSQCLHALLRTGHRLLCILLVFPKTPLVYVYTCLWR